MALVTLPYTLTAGQPENVNQLNSNLAALVAGVNDIDTAQINDGQITPNLLSTPLAQQIGVVNSVNIGRGKFVQATAGTRSNTAYGALSNGPDEVANIVLPSDGLIAVMYQAQWQETVAGSSKAAIFIGANQLKTRWSGLDAPADQGASLSGAPTANKYRLLSTNSGGLYASRDTADVRAFSTDVTTGQIVGATLNGFTTGTAVDVTSVAAEASGGGPCWIFAAAGTYTISVQYKSTSGTITARERKLWVWTQAFS